MMLTDKAMTTKYKGQCDRLRKSYAGEQFWQQMMFYAKPISKEVFLRYVNPVEVLDNAESIDDFMVGDETAGFFASIVDERLVYFIQYAGFEFIWVDADDERYNKGIIKRFNAAGVSYDGLNLYYGDLEIRFPPVNGHLPFWVLIKLGVQI